MLAHPSEDLGTLIHALKTAALALVVDVATDLAELRSRFFASGGHDVLVLTPALEPGIARAAIDTLRAVAPELPIVSFAAALQRRDLPATAGLTCVASLHPGSRAGVGAVLRSLHSTPPPPPQPPQPPPEST